MQVPSERRTPVWIITTQHSTYVVTETVRRHLVLPFHSVAQAIQRMQASLVRQQLPNNTLPLLCNMHTDSSTGLSDKL